jgi:hypothetical protein
MGRKKKNRLESERPIPYSFSLKPGDDDIAIRNLQTWFEYCVANLEAPAGGWSNNAMIKSLLTNLDNDMIRDDIFSPYDADVVAGLDKTRKLIVDEFRLTRKLIADVQATLSNGSFAKSYNSYEKSPRVQDLGYVSENVGETEWIDDE